MSTVAVYLLFDPETNVPRYVGKTKDVSVRFRAHRVQRDSSRRSQWIEELRSRGLLPIMEVIDILSPEKVDAEERFWIAALRGNGYDLVNATSGGDGQYSLSVESKEKIAAAKRGVPRSPETIARMSAAMTGRVNGPHSVAARQKMREFRLAHPELQSCGGEHGKAKFTDEQAQEMRIRFSESPAMTYADIAREYGTDRTNARDIIIGAAYPNSGGPIGLQGAYRDTWRHLARHNLSPQQIDAIRTRYANETISFRKLGREYGVSHDLVAKVIRQS